MSSPSSQRSQVEHHAACRNFTGYGANPPNPKWPGGAKLCVSFVLNMEEGGENCVLNGDGRSEVFLNETPGAPFRQARDIAMESQYEYGSRAGVWRVLRMFKERDIPLTIYGVGRSLELNPDIARAFVDHGHEIASHSYRWIDYQGMNEEEERRHIQLAIEAQVKTTGTRPLGWYTGRLSENTTRLVAEEGGFAYSSDSYADDLPYYDNSYAKPLLMIPYTLDNNDMKFSVGPGFTSGEAFTQYLKDCFDVLYEEGNSGQPKMMSIGLHCRLVGRPGRTKALMKFLDYAKSFEGVWFARRIEIAHHWMKTFPPQTQSKI